MDSFFVGLYQSGEISLAEGPKQLGLSEPSRIESIFAIDIDVDMDMDMDMAGRPKMRGKPMPIQNTTIYVSALGASDVVCI